MKKKSQRQLSGIPWPVERQKDQNARVPWLKKAGRHRLEPQSPVHHLKIGSEAEQIAHDFLLRQGLICVERNFRARVGEIDLIMSKGSLAIVVEVRRRSRLNHGCALESVDHWKQTKVRRCAALWWQLKGCQRYQSLRFDVIAIDKNLQVQWVENAFDYSIG